MDRKAYIEECLYPQPLLLEQFATFFAQSDNRNGDRVGDALNKMKESWKANSELVRYLDELRSDINCD